MTDLAKVRLDKDKSGRVEFGLRSVMTSPEVKAVLAECKRRRDKEAILGVKPDPYQCMFMLPAILEEKICKQNRIKPGNYKKMARIVERDYPAFKTTNTRIA